MGLDWNPMGRPKAGHEPEFEAIFRALEMDPKNPARDAWVRRFQMISEAPYTTLGAPRVGTDAAADAWLRGRLKDASKFDEARAQMNGVYVLDLLPECDGFPRYSNYTVAQGNPGYERYTFRGQFLNDCKAVIGDELHAAAFGNKLAGELAAYASALEAKTLPFAQEHGLMRLQNAGAAVGDFKDGAPESVADILFSAIRWCRFWATRGHGLEPWY